MKLSTSTLIAIAVLGLGAEAASAAPITPASIFANSPPALKLVMIGLLGSCAAAVVVGGLKLASGPRLAGGSAFLSALRFGGPLAGLMGAAWNALMMSMGLANSHAAPTAQLLAPGLAEGAMLLVLGFLTGAIAVIMNWAVEARIDREVLKT
jgi:hypothetical protein